MAYSATNLPNVSEYPDYSGYFGLGGFGEDSAEPEPWERYGLADWGRYVPMYEARDGIGVISGELLGGLSAEVDTDVYQGLARTPMIEVAPQDYEWMQKTHFPYDGMMGLGDDGQVYVYDGLGGFFKKLFKKIRRGVKKVAHRIRSVARKIIKRLPGGKMLLKIGGKIKKVAMKVIKPVTKFIGKYAKKLAPVAAFIPGYGPAIAAGLRVAGRVANVSRKFMGGGGGVPPQVNYYGPGPRWYQ